MPLTEKQRAQLERRLLEERARVRETLADVDRRLRTTEQDAAGDLSLVPLHPADLGTDEIGREMDGAEETRGARALEEIDAALERLYTAPERFGRDERTGEEIPLARLLEVPWARTRADAPPSGESPAR